MSFEEQMMSKDKYPSTFSRQMKAIVFIILQTETEISSGQPDMATISWSLG